MRQTFIVALLSAVVLGDGVLIDSDDECPYLKKAPRRLDDSSPPTWAEIPLKGTINSTEIGLIFDFGDEMKRGSVGQSTMQAKWNLTVEKAKLNDEFSVGLCWLTDPENQMKNDEQSWDCQTQFLEIKEGEQKQNTPFQNWTLVQSESGGMTSFTKAEDGWFTNIKKQMKCNPADSDQNVTCPDITFEASHSQEKFSDPEPKDSDYWNRWLYSWPIFAIYAEGPLSDDDGTNEVAKIKALDKNENGWNYRPWFQSNYARQYLLTELNYYTQTIACIQGSYSKKLDDMRKPENGFRPMIRTWYDDLEQISKSYQEELPIVTDVAITDESGDDYTYEDFQRITASQISSAAKIADLDRQYETISTDGYENVHWKKIDLISKADDLMNRDFLDMQTVYQKFEETVTAISENENTRKRNKQVLTGEIASLRSRYSNKFGDEETSQLKEIEERNNGTPVQTDLEIKKAQESANEEWQTGVFGYAWTENQISGSKAMDEAEVLRAKAAQDSKDGILATISQQEEDQKAIKKLFERYTAATKYGFEREGAVTIGSYMAALAATAFAALI